MQGPEKLATYGIQDEEKHNSICVRHHNESWEVRKDHKYLFIYGHVVYISLMVESRLRNDKIYVRTTWHDLFVLSQHERDNRIHNIFSKSVM
jgi:hypothetical protein